MPGRKTQPVGDIKITRTDWNLWRNQAGLFAVQGIPGVQDGSPSYQETPVEVFPQRRSSTRVDYGIYPAQDETVLSIEDFSNGMGRKYERRDDELSYYYSEDIDASHDGEVRLGPEMRTATVSGITSILKFFSYGDGNIYALAVDSAGDGHVVRTTGNPAAASAPTWTAQAEYPGADDADQSLIPSSVAVFRGTADSAARAYLNAETAHSYMHAVAPASTITEHSGGEPAGGFAAGGDEMWRFEGGTANVSKTTNGGATPTWGSNIVVGEAGRPIVAITMGIDSAVHDSAKNNRLYIMKSDGLYTLNAAGDAFSQYLTPMWQEMYDPQNMTSFGEHLEHLLFRFNDGIWSYSYRNGMLIQIGPEILKGNDVLRGSPTAFASDGEYVYVAIKANSDNITRIHKGKFYLGEGGNIANIDWHPIKKVGTANQDVNDLYFSKPVADQDPALLVGMNTGTIGHITLGEENLRYSSSGSIYLPRFHDVPGESKLFSAMDIVAEGVTNTETITAVQRTNPGTSFTTVAVWDAIDEALGKRQQFPIPARARLVETRLDFASTLDVTKTPKLSSYELRFAYRVTPRWVDSIIVDVNQSTASRTGQVRPKTLSPQEARTEIRGYLDRGALLYIDPDGNEKSAYVRQQQTKIVLVSKDPGHPPKYAAVMQLIDAQLTTTVGTWSRSSFFTWSDWSSGTWGGLATRSFP